MLGNPHWGITKCPRAQTHDNEAPALYKELPSKPSYNKFCSSISQSLPGSAQGPGPGPCKILAQSSSALLKSILGASLSLNSLPDAGCRRKEAKPSMTWYKCIQYNTYIYIYIYDTSYWPHMLHARCYMHCQDLTMHGLPWILHCHHLFCPDLPCNVPWSLTMQMTDWQ